MPSLTKFDGRWIFVIGGRDATYLTFTPNPSHSIPNSYFDTVNETWSTFTSLKPMRFGHSSCELGDMLYVFSGLGHNNIERINAREIVMGDDAV